MAIKARPLITSSVFPTQSDLAILIFQQILIGCVLDFVIESILMYSGVGYIPVKMLGTTGNDLGVIT